MEMFRLSLWMFACLLKIDEVLSEPTMSLLKFDSEFFCTLTNDNLDSALFWGYQNAEDTVRYNSCFCDIEKKASCQLELLPYGWKWIDDTDFSPILDRRWESIKGEQIYGEPSNVYESDGNSFRLSFSFKAAEVHIFLCDKKCGEYNYGNCFWIALGANNGKTNYFRKCATGSIPTDVKLYPNYPCNKRLINSSMSDTLDKNHWKHFTFIKKKNEITLLRYPADPILEYRDKKDSSKFKYVCVRNGDSKETDGFMKVHKVRTLFASSTSAEPLQINLVKSNQPKCFALYAKTCRDCELIIKLSNKTSVLLNAKSKKLDGWQRITLKTDVSLSRDTEISIKVSEPSGNANGNWYISNCIQSCDANDIPVIPGGSKDGCCYALKYPHLSICTRDLSTGISPTDQRCASNEIGKNCIPCKSLSGSDCLKSKICDTTASGLVCSCSSGYWSNDCSKTCKAGFYGHDCSKRCGKCTNTCNFVDGSCYCEDNFLGDRCDTPILPIVKQAPHIRKPENKRIILSIDLNYDGLNIPKWYLVQYQQQFENWKPAGSISQYVNQSVDYIIPNLQPNTNYTVRVLLYTENDEVYKDKYVPVQTMKTTCTDITFDLMKEDVTNTSINIEFNENNSELCPPSQFQLYLYERDIFKEHLQLALRNFFNGLKSCQEYRIDLIKDSTTIANRTIITKEGVPDKVQDVRYEETDTSVLLTWNYPANTNCKIGGYRVEYTCTRSIGCYNLQLYGDKKVIHVSDNKTTINSLTPYSHYRVKIWAFNTYEGADETVEFDTKERSTPTVQEFPAFSISNPKNELIIKFQWNCTSLQGPLQFKVLLLCRNDWCRNEASPSFNIYNHMLEVEHKFIVTGKTNYTLRMSISRNGQEISSDSNILTEPTEPNAVRNLIVYSKNNTSMSVRWLPPYPPTGEIECYFVKYHDSLSVEIKVERTSECKLWKGKICTTITNLNSNRIIYLTVTAKNINVKQKGAEATTNSPTKEEVSDPPQNITLKWDERYNLIVKWQHPDRTNGDLVEFLLTVNKSNLSPLHVNTEEAEYEYKYEIPLTLTSKALNIGVAAKNSAGISPTITAFTYSPPKAAEFSTDPLVEDIKNTSFVLRIPQISNIEGNVSNMYIIITDIAQPIEREYLHPMSRELMEKVDAKSENSWIVGEFNLRNTTIQNGLLFEVGDDMETLSKIEDNWKFKNRKLNTGRTYNVYFLLNNTFMQFNRYQTYTIRDVVLSGQSSTSPLYILILLVLPVILCIVCVIIVRRHRQKVTSSIYVGLQQLGISRNTRDVPMRPLVRENNTPTPENSIAKPTTVVPKKTEEPATDDDRKYTKPIKLNDLNQYIKESIENGEFERQHGVFQRGQTKSWNQGTKPQNKAKNRYTNLAAYDHTRVKLEIINKDPFSDYINANYIDGYKSQKAYIATQGPKVSTLNDFWRMIWQENVEYIIMIANLIEGGKKKVEKYWPEINESNEFDDIRVKYLSVDVMANYEIRYFNVSCNGEKRKIQQLHFLTWPDHGVPLYAQSLSPFLKKMLTIPQGKSPVVVHCSAGVGRTGSLILCDICLRMAAREGKIDVFYYLNKIRNQRVNMVDNVEQYKLVHLVLLQCLVAPETGFLCNETMEKSVEIIISTKIEEEMDYLEESSWQDEAMRTTNVQPDLPIIPSKNRFANVSIESSSRICLSPYPSSDEASTYINAVSVDAFATPSKFIVTQNPLNSTVGDFWRLVEENQVTMIICLNQLDFQDKTTCKFYPTSSAQPMKPVPYLEIKYTGKEVNTHFKVYSVTMSRLDGQEDDLHVKIMHLNNWRNNAMHPENPIGLLMAYEEMNRLGRTSDTILISCHDGVKACGLYVAMCFVIDKIQMEQICDVCLAVRTVRHGRKEFVRDAKQFAFLYQCGLEYVRQFEMYSNFSSTKISK